MAIILRHGMYESFYGRTLFVNWPLTFMCNYNCSYCFGHEKMDRSRFSSVENCKVAIANMAALNRPLYDVTLVGGEPTIHPAFLEICQMLADKLGERLNRIYVTTNGSRSVDFYKALMPIARQHEVALNVSIHTDHASAAHMAELVENLASAIDFQFNLMYNPARLDFAEELFAMLLQLRRRHAFDLNIATLREPPDFSMPDKRYTGAMRRRQKEMAREFTRAAAQSPCRYTGKKGVVPTEFMEIWTETGSRKLPLENRHIRLQKGLMSFKGMRCIAGANLLRIEPDGQFRGLVCPQASYDGNIFTPGLGRDFLKPRAVECAQANCGCPANDVAPKFRDAAEAAFFIGQKPDVPAVSSFATNPAVQATDALWQKYGNLVTIIGAARPDALQTYTRAGQVDMAGILKWAYFYGRREHPLIARMERQLADAYAEMTEE